MHQFDNYQIESIGNEMPCSHPTRFSEILSTNHDIPLPYEYDSHIKRNQVLSIN